MYKKLPRRRIDTIYKPQFRTPEPSFYNPRLPYRISYYDYAYKRLREHSYNTIGSKNVPLSDVVDKAKMDALFDGATHWAIWQKGVVVAKSDGLWVPANHRQGKSANG